MKKIQLFILKIHSQIINNIKLEIDCLYKKSVVHLYMKILRSLCIFLNIFGYQDVELTES